MSATTHLPAVVRSEALLGCTGADSAPSHGAELVFDRVYREHFAFVWRSARRLGVGDASLDDVVQEVFVVVHRRLADFEGRSSLKTWLFGITLRLVRDHRRAMKRRAPASDRELETVAAEQPDPSENAQRGEAVRMLHAILDQLEDEQREVFVMAELEQLTMPEIASAIGINVNTAYARLRLAREDFDRAVTRQSARDEWRMR